MRQLSADCETMLLILMNSRNDVFGGLITEAWRPTLGRSYYGTGSCLVWTFYQGETVHVYPATGVNDYYILTCDKYFAMGSGGNFAIYIVSIRPNTSSLLFFIGILVFISILTSLGRGAP
jgi:hypothetical protein